MWYGCSERLGLTTDAPGCGSRLPPSHSRRLPTPSGPAKREILQSPVLDFLARSQSRISPRIRRCPVRASRFRRHAVSRWRSSSSGRIDRDACGVVSRAFLALALPPSLPSDASTVRPPCLRFLRSFSALRLASLIFSLPGDCRHPFCHLSSRSLRSPTFILEDWRLPCFSIRHSQKYWHRQRAGH